MDIFNTLFYQPLFNLLVLLYQLFPGGNLGVAVILLTILIKILLYPLNRKALVAQEALSRLEPKLKELKDKYKNDKEALARETMAVYKEAKINPFSGLVTLFIQLPVLIALYQVFGKFASSGELANLYSFVPKIESINPFFLTINLSEANIILAVLAGLTLFVQLQVMARSGKKKPLAGENQFQEIFQKQMNYFLPVFTLFILLKVPSAISLYILVNNLISIIETKYVFQKRIG